jgi:hypothetical protein
MEQLIRDMDVRIRKNKERADAESRPKVLKLDDQKRLDAIKQQQAGESLQAIWLHNNSQIQNAPGAVQICAWWYLHMWQGCICGRVGACVC